MKSAESCRQVRDREGDFLNWPWSFQSEIIVVLDGKSRYRFNKCI